MPKNSLGHVWLNERARVATAFDSANVCEVYCRIEDDETHVLIVTDHINELIFL